MSDCGKSKEEWRERLARHARSGLSVVAFCKQEGVSTPSFYTWRRKLEAEGQPARTKTSLSVDESTRATSAEFLPVRLIGSSQVSVELPGGTRLQVPLADPQTLQWIVSTVVRLDAERAGRRP